MGVAGERPPATLRLLEAALAARDAPITVDDAHRAVGYARSLSSVRVILQKLVIHGYMERTFEVIHLRRVAVYKKTAKWAPPHNGLWVKPPGYYLPKPTPTPPHVDFRLFNCGYEQFTHHECTGWTARKGAWSSEILVCSCKCGHAEAIRLLNIGVLQPPPEWTVEQLVSLIKATDSV